MAAVSGTGDVTDVAGQPGSARGTDAAEALQAAAGPGGQTAQLGAGGPDFPADGGEVADQLAGQLAAGAPGNVTRPHGCRQGPGLRGGQELLRPAGP